jgi:prophage regulatory protein
MQELILRAPDVARVTGLSVRTMRRLEKAGAFPKHVVLSARTIGWHRQAVEKWVEDKIAAQKLVEAV